jgi:hypothetical protein
MSQSPNVLLVAHGPPNALLTAQNRRYGPIEHCALFQALGVDPDTLETAEISRRHVPVRGAA